MNIQRRMNNGGMPPEVLSLIFEHLHYLDILRCSLICKWFHDVIAGDPLMRYLITLGKHGLVVGPHDGRPVHERLHFLLDQRARWRELAQCASTCPIVRSTKTLTYTDGVLIQCVERTDKKQGATLFIHYMPATRTNSTVIYSPFHIDFVVAAAAIDPVRGLLVLVQMPTSDDPNIDKKTAINVHLLQVRLGCRFSVNPEARKSVLKLEYDTVVHRNCEVSALRIAGNKLMLCLGGLFLFSSLYIWDWTTGDMLVKRTPNEIFSARGAYSEPYRAHSSLKHLVPGLWFFAEMLSPDMFIMSYYMPTCIPNEETRREEANNGCAFHLVTLMLPEPVDNFEIKPHIIAGPYLPDPDPRTPFSGDPSSRIIVIDLGIRKSSSAPCIIVRQTALIALAERYALRLSRGAGGDPKAMKVPWEEWGPQNTRVLETARSGDFPRAVGAIHGQRGVFTLDKDYEDDHDCTCILDFNLCPSMVAVDLGNPPQESRTRLVTEPSTVCSEYFKEPITPSLPYYETLLGPLDDPEVVCGLDEHRLVHLEPNSDSEGKDDLLVFLV
ncbi:hypothetical protein EWM64_g6585 [Hericium alpestre]|uniref:F-box domain-containing protein n=1 Tax=Hericium alpestre TaxID=135208 RepID=A0A4Y9ZRB9_9AGAM|nr:hypothetical protein EWM64_g6585 [Hericium alpestre]